MQPAAASDMQLAIPHLAKTLNPLETLLGDQPHELLQRGLARDRRTITRCANPRP